jgi:hypothetical protein
MSLMRVLEVMRVWSIWSLVFGFWSLVFVVCFWQNYEKVLYVQVFRVINLLEIIVKLGLIRRGGWLACARYFSTDYHGLTRMGFLTEVFFFRRGELSRISTDGLPDGSVFFFAAAN